MGLKDIGLIDGMGDAHMENGVDDNGVPGWKVINPAPNVAFAGDGAVDIARGEPGMCMCMCINALGVLKRLGVSGPWLIALGVKRSGEPNSVDAC
jgi:hypothetical protein